MTQVIMHVGTVVLVGKAIDCLLTGSALATSSLQQKQDVLHSARTPWDFACAIHDGWKALHLNEALRSPQRNYNSSTN
eukprot:5744617-Amphidinium_carterae.1